MTANQDTTSGISEGTLMALRSKGAPTPATYTPPKTVTPVQTNNPTPTSQPTQTQGGNNDGAIGYAKGTGAPIYGNKGENAGVNGGASTGANGNKTFTDANGNSITTDASGKVLSSSGGGYAVGSYYGGSDQSYNTAESSLMPQNIPSEEKFYSDVYSQLQPVIDSINQAEQYAETEANIQAQNSTKAQNFSMNAQGLAGSSESDAMAGKIEQTRGAAIAKAKSDQANAMSQLVQFAVPEAYNQYKDALTRNDANSQAYIKQVQTNMNNVLGGLSNSGIMLNDLQQSNPQEYQQLVQYANGDPNNLNAMYISMASQNLLNNGQPMGQVGDNLIYGIKVFDQATGEWTMKTESFQLPAGYSSTFDPSTDVKVVPNMGIFVRNTADPTGQTWSNVGGANPYYMANQAATLQSKDAMMTSRYGTAINGIIKQLGYTTTSNPLTMYANSINYTAKLNAAYEASTSNDPSIDKGVSDVDLIDSYIKIANGGGQVTDSQLSALNQSLGLSGKAALTMGRLTGTSQLLTPAQRDTIYKLSQDNLKKQQANAEAAQQVIQSRAAAAGIPANMVGNVQDIVGLSAASNPTADAATQVGSVVQDATGLPDGTTGVDDSGNSMVVKNGQWVTQ